MISGWFMLHTSETANDGRVMIRSVQPTIAIRQFSLREYAMARESLSSSRPTGRNFIPLETRSASNARVD